MADNLKGRLFWTENAGRIIKVRVKGVDISKNTKLAYYNVQPVDPDDGIIPSVPADILFTDRKACENYAWEKLQKQEEEERTEKERLLSDLYKMCLKNPAFADRAVSEIFRAKADRVSGD